uniref:Uncharacterized protein n=1 Tax=Frankia torreyi TaxID=1856 RepID=Q9AF03_9ACTN|nr:hypothetical protein [Frankia torreyi]
MTPHKIAAPPPATRLTSTLIVGRVGTGKTVETVARTRAHLDAGGLVWLAGDPLPAGGVDHRRLDWHERGADGIRSLIEVACRLAAGRLRLDAAVGPLLLVADPWPTGPAAGRLTWLAEHGPTGVTPVGVVATALRPPPGAVWGERIDLPAALPL